MVGFLIQFLEKGQEMNNETKEFILLTLATHIQHVRSIILQEGQVLISCCDGVAEDILLDVLCKKTNARPKVPSNRPVIVITKGRKDE